MAGNQLAVVLDADGLSDESMLAFARETRLAETTFVQAASAEGADYRNRIFTVAGEVPFAGHPSLGTAVAVAMTHGKQEASYVQQTGVGLQPVEVHEEGEHWNASMLQEPATFGPEVNPSHVMAAAGLLTGDAHRELVPQVVSTGLPTLIAVVRDKGAITRAAPDFDLVDHVLAGCGATNLYIAWHNGAGAACARMFTRLVEGGEDPATGSAVGPLCAYLARLGLGEKVVVTQGTEIGRPSRLVAEIDGDRIRVSGGVVEIIEGRVNL